MSWSRPVATTCPFARDRHILDLVSPGVALTARWRNLTDEIYARSITDTPLFFLGAPRSFEIGVRLTR